MRIILAAATVLAISALGYPEQAFAQEHGCPWCVTPTRCDEIDQDTPIGGCENVGNGCEEIEGSCEALRILAPDTRGVFLRTQGIDYRGETSVSIHGLTFEAIGVGAGLYARWSCDGSVAAIFTQSEDGTWTTLESDRFSGRYDLTLPRSG